MKNSVLLVKLEAHVQYLLSLLAAAIHDVNTTIINFLKISSDVERYNRKIVILRHRISKQNLVTS